MELRDYKFRANHWPPPDDRKSRDVYLFGFDEDNQPYIVRWENHRGEEGWVATTLSENKSSLSSAIPRSFEGTTVGKLLQYWADAPALMRTVFKIKAKAKQKNKHFWTDDESEDE